VAAVEEAEGAVGALVNNAGYSQSGAIETVPMDQIRRQFETNVFGLIRMAQLVLPGMRRQGWGRIVNVSSMGGKVTFPGGGIYHATKFSVEAISDVLRYETRGFGIDVSCVEPGLIKTQFGEAAVGSMEGEVTGAGDYAEFNAAVASATASAYSSGPMSWFAAEPDAVAKVIEKAITRKRPRSRYVVTFGAKALMAQRRLSPDRVWDAFLKTQFPQPK
jgi:short-subunit dehydrogenase